MQCAIVGVENAVAPDVDGPDNGSTDLR